MNLFYVMGGGVGHLTRVHTFINQFQIDDVRILTNNPLASSYFSNQEIIKIEGNTSKEVAQHVVQTLKRVRPTEVYIDSFPCGLFGELTFTKETPLHYIARRLKWNVYRELCSDAIRFQNTYCVEELEPEHKAFIEKQSKQKWVLQLNYPQPRPETIPQHLIPIARPLWLVVHAFIKEEVEALVAYAKETARITGQRATMVLVSDQQIEHPDVVTISYFPAVDWFPLADKIFTGAGFNALQQLQAFNDKTVVMPFPRKLDDQFWRARQFLAKARESQLVKTEH
jgi:hypothetical protein